MFAPHEGIRHEIVLYETHPFASLSWTYNNLCGVANFTHESQHILWMDAITKKATNQYALSLQVGWCVSLQAGRYVIEVDV